MLRIVERRSYRLLLVRGRIFRDRRTSRRRIHMIGDRRDPHRALRRFYKSMYMYILTIVSAATWALLQQEAEFNAPVLFGCIVIGLSLMVRPLKLALQT